MCGCNTGCAPCAAKARLPLGYDPAAWSTFEQVAAAVRTVGQAHALAVAALGATRQARDELASRYIGGKFDDEATAAAARASAIRRLGSTILALTVLEARLRADRIAQGDAAPIPEYGLPLITGAPPLALAGGVIMGELAPHVAEYGQKAAWWVPRLADALFRGSGASTVLPFTTGAQALAALCLIAIVAVAVGRRL